MKIKKEQLINQIKANLVDALDLINMLENNSPQEAINGEGSQDIQPVDAHPPNLVIDYEDYLKHFYV